MALQVTYSITQTDNCGTISVVDTTGAYDVSLNPGGYGSPNSDYGDIVGSDFEFTLPDGTTETLDMSFIPAPGALSQDFTPADFAGLAGLTEFPNGVYELVYNIYVSGPTLESSKDDKFVLYCTILNCILNVILKAGIGVAKDGCTCDSEIHKKASELRTLLESVVIASSTDNQLYDSANAILEELEDKCDNVCNDCC